MGAFNARTTNLTHAAKPIVGSFQEFTVSSTAGLLYSFANNAQKSNCEIVRLMCETSSIRWTSDGTTPSPTAVPKATYTTVTSVSNADLKFTAVQSGTGGNAISVAYVDPGAASQALSVVVTGNAIVVNLATDSGSAITSTGTLIKNAVNASAAASALVVAALAPANSGAGIVIAITATLLSGATSGGFILATGTPLYISAGEAATMKVVASSSDSVVQIEEYRI